MGFGKIHFSKTHRTSTLEHVKLEQVPEIVPDDLPRIFGFIALNFTVHGPSFGAFVLRDTPDGILGTCNTYMRAFGKTKSTKKFRDDLVLHTDTAGTMPVTAHRTTLGKCRALFLPGSVLIHDPKPISYKEGHRIMTDGEIDTANISLPRVALITLLGPGDLVVFDHSQPHLFEKASETREACGVFVD